MTLGERIKATRKDYKLTQKELAKILGIDHTTISKWESDIYEPDTDMLNKLADLLDTSVDYLLGRTDDPKPSIASQMLRAAEHGLRGEDMNGERKKDSTLKNAVLESYERLSPENKKLIDDMIKALSDEKT